MTCVGKEDSEIRARDSERFIHYRVVNPLSLILVTLPSNRCDAIDDDGCGDGDNGNHNSSLHQILSRTEVIANQILLL